MTHDTKVIIGLLAESIGRTKNLKEAYAVLERIAGQANTKIPPLEAFRRSVGETGPLASAPETKKKLNKEAKAPPKVTRDETGDGELFLDDWND